MQKSEDAVILMQQNFNDVLDKIKYSVGSAEIVSQMPCLESLKPFDDEIIEVEIPKDSKMTKVLNFLEQNELKEK